MQINYKKVFSQLSHIKALSHDQKFDAVIQNLIIYSLVLNPNIPIITDSDVQGCIKELFGITIRLHIVQSNIDKLLDSKEILRDREKRLSPSIATKSNVQKRILEATKLEERVKTRWISELEYELASQSGEEIWNCLKAYLYKVFEQHGVQTLNLLNPSMQPSNEEQINLTMILDEVISEGNYQLPKEALSNAINTFILDADEERVNYLSSLVDATFTSFALTADADTVNFLNSRLSNISLFLDTNFIFGILDLHKNNEDGAAKEIMAELRKNRLPLSLTYHPETLAEFKRAFESKALLLKSTKWSRTTSRLALEVDGLSALEELYHKQNLDQEVDPHLFLDKYEHVDLILRDIGLIEHIPGAISDIEHAEIEEDIEAYQNFYESLPHRKGKSYASFKHDIVALREVRSLNSKKTKFLDSKAIFISSDYVLSKFERTHLKKSWEMGFVVSPSVFLQLIRPFIENDYKSNKRFVDTFSIPEIRSFEIDYTTTRSKALQILNDNYHDASFETRIEILRDEVLLKKINSLQSDYAGQVSLIENRIALENQALTEQKRLADEAIKEREQTLQRLNSENENLQNGSDEKDLEITALKGRLAALENIQVYKDQLNQWKNQQELYISDKILKTRQEYRRSARYCIRPTIALVTSAALGGILSRFYAPIQDWLLESGTPSFALPVTCILLSFLAAYELLYRSYFVDREKVKNGLLWVGTFGLTSRKDALIELKKHQYSQEFLVANPEPAPKDSILIKETAQR